MIRYAKVLSWSAVCVLTVFTNNQVSRQACLTNFEFSMSSSYSSTHSYIHKYIYFLSILHNLCLNKHSINAEKVCTMKNKDLRDSWKIPTEDLLNSFSSFCSNGKISSVNRALDCKKKSNTCIAKVYFHIQTNMYMDQNLHHFLIKVIWG